MSLTSRCFVLGAVICLALNGSGFSEGAEPRLSPVPSLSVGDMIDVMDSAGIPRGAVRGQFLSELVQSFECNVQTRWHGLEVVTEKTINEIAYIDNLRIPENEIQAADFVICGNYADKDNGAMGYLYCTDLLSDSRQKTLQGTFETKDTFELPESMARATGTLLSLAPRKPASSMGSALQKDLIWMISPILRCAPGWGVGSTMDAKLAMQVEAALQQQGVIKKIVDRQALDAILKEHNMANLPEQGLAQARMLSKLKKADILLTGQVAPWQKNNRIDLFLIDSRTGCLLAACTAKDVQEQDLSDVCIKLAIRLAETPIVMPASIPSTPDRRRREAEVLTSRAHYPDLFAKGGGFTFARVRSELESQINAAEGSYLLVHDDDAYVYRNIVRLWNGYKRWGFWNTPPNSGIYIMRSEFKNLECMQRTACLINYALQRSEHSSETPTPLLYRADSSMYAGRYAEAIDLAQAHLSRYPAVDDGWALEIMAQSHYKLGHLDLAGDFARRSIACQPDSWFTHEILKELNHKESAKDLNAAVTMEDVKALETYRKLLAKERTKIDVKDWKRYLEVLRKVEGPRKALDINLFISSWLLEYAEKFLLKELPGQIIDPQKMMSYEIYMDAAIFPLAMMHIALCSEELGEHGKAVRIFRNVIENNKICATGRELEPLLKEMNNEAEQMVVRIESQNGPVIEEWKSGIDIKPIAEKYCIYIVPVGPFDNGRINATMSVLYSFFGTNGVKLLPTVPIPESSAKQGSFNYQCTPLFKSLFKSAVIPDDAIHAVFITELPVENAGILCAGQMDEFDEPVALSPVILSFLTIETNWTPLPQSAKIRDLAWQIINSFRYIYAGKATPLQNKWRARSPYPGGRTIGYGFSKETCTAWTCIFRTELWDFYASKLSRLTMCPKCQQEYEKADFEKIHNDLIRYLKSVGVKIIKADEVASR